MLSKNVKRFFCETISPFLHRAAQEQPTLYLLSSCAVAVAGFAYLIIFPSLFMVSIGKLYTLYPETISSGMHFSHYLWLSLFLISTLVSFRIFSFRFPKIEGVRVKPEKLPTLFTVLDTLQQETGNPTIQRVIVTDKYELELIKSPIFGIPFWSHNILVIGLPFLQSLSSAHFRCALTRKLLQFNKRGNLLSNWLYQMRQIWQHYLRQLQRDCRFGEQALLWFFMLYTPLFRSITVSAAQLDELVADRKVLDMINNDDVFKTIESIIISKIFLSKQYWPKVRGMFKQDPNANIYPYAKLERIIKSAFMRNDLKQWLEKNYEMESGPLDTTPTLKARMDVLGRKDVKPPSSPNETAAMVYLENAYSEVVKRIDEKWLKKQRQRKGEALDNETSADNFFASERNTPVQQKVYLEADSVMR